MWPRLVITAVLVSSSAAGCSYLLGEVPSATGAFSPAGSLGEARYGHTATSLPDGRVLVVGGSDGEDPLASAEVWDPVTASFGPAGSLYEGHWGLREARYGHTATLLLDGRVLIVGGSNIAGRPLASAEVWDPATGSFGPAGALAAARRYHTATLLPDGRVLVVGGGPPYDVLASAEVWDPETGEFSPSGSLAEARQNHTATLLPDGRVLIVGGHDADPVFARKAAEVWVPATASFTPAASLRMARGFHTATLLPDGRVLVVGGYGPDLNILTSAEVWDPATASFAPAASLGEARGFHTATLLPDGKVLVVGGIDTDWVTSPVYPTSAEVWDPATASFGPSGYLAEGRGGHTASPLTDGRVLIIGGSDGEGVLASAEVWDPEPPAGE